MGYLEYIHEDNKSYYKTTDTGREKFQEITGKKCYSSTSYIHDKALAEVYMSLTDAERAT